jgi:hypothetical protein
VGAEVESKRTVPKSVKSILVNRAAWTMRRLVIGEELEAEGGVGAVKEGPPVRCLVEIGEGGVKCRGEGGEEEGVEMGRGVGAWDASQLNELLKTRDPSGGKGGRSEVVGSEEKEGDGADGEVRERKRGAADGDGVK